MRCAILIAEFIDIVIDPFSLFVLVSQATLEMLS